MGRLAVLAVLTLLLLSLGFALTISHHHTSHVTEPHRFNVEVATAHKMTIPQVVLSVGGLVAMQQVTISSELDGRVTKVFFKDGDFVSQGMPIVQLDDSQAKADVAQAQAALNLSKTTYARYLAANKEGAFSQQDIDKARADVESKQAVLESAQATLKEKEIRAPFSGTLGAFNIQAGDYVTAGQALVSLVDKRRLKVKYTVAESVLPKMHLGQAVQIAVDGLPKQQFKGVVSFLSPAINKATRSVGVQATIDNKQGRLTPGMFAHVRQIVATNPNAIVVPEQAVITSLQGHTVFRVGHDDTVMRVKITLNDRYQGFAAISSGINLGDTVVIAGQQKLQDGSKVHIINSKSAVH